MMYYLTWFLLQTPEEFSQRMLGRAIEPSARFSALPGGLNFNYLIISSIIISYFKCIYIYFF